MPAEERDGIRELNPEELCRKWQPEEFNSEVEPDTGFSNGVWLGISQDRLFKALDFGLSRDAPDHHIFVSGITGPTVLEALEKFVLDFENKNTGELSQLRDWCYVYNFDNPRNPVAIPLPAGRGKVLRFKMKKNLSRLQDAIPNALNSENVAQEHLRATSEFNDWFSAAQESTRKRAAENQEAIVEFGDSGFDVNIIPWRYKSLNEEEREELGRTLASKEKQRDRNTISKYMPEIIAIRNEFLKRDAKLREELNRINQSAIKEAIQGVFRSLRGKLSENSRSTALTRYIDSVEKFATENYPIFLQGKNKTVPRVAKQEPDIFIPWEVNVFVDNSNAKGPPVVIELDPTFENLVGRIEKVVMAGGMVSTDHTRIAAGSLAQANGGYLLLNIRDVLVRPGAYEALKNAVKNKTLEISELMSAMGYGSMSSLDPTPIPLNLKLVVTGIRGLWEYLSHADPEFSSIFKIKADVNPDVDRSPDEASAWARWMTKQYSEHGLLPLENDAMGRIIDYASRVAGSKKRIATNFGLLQDLMSESSYVAKKEGAERISAQHVRSAIADRKFRLSLYQERRLRSIQESHTLIDVEGGAVGQINGLVIFGGRTEDAWFGGPSRITAQVSMGKPGFINIQRESKMSGPYLDMADAIVNRYLMGTYAKKYPIALQISIAFEQSYGGVDGDSASLAQLYATLSAVAEVPIRQDVAITGSLNQRGAVQVIGGVNDKIEGFFDACLAKGGLSGTQGVIIPEGNVSDLMLREDVVEAVQNGRFHVWAVSHVSGGIKILLGMPAGERDNEGKFPEGTFNAIVDEKLQSYARNAKNFFKDEEAEK
ncbi:MAG: ATP-binding protein [Candidatus Spechtbacterales bacterium]